MLASSIKKRALFIGEHKTSISLEEAFWESLKDIAAGREMTVSQLVTEIDAKHRKEFSNCSSAVRVFVLEYYKQQVVCAKSAAALQAPEATVEG